MCPNCLAQAERIELCLWREHVREWLAERHAFPGRYGHAWVIERQELADEVPCKVLNPRGEIEEPDSAEDIQTFSDYTLALIAGAKAVGKEQQ